MATLQGVTRRGWLHDLLLREDLSLDRQIRFWLDYGSPYSKLRYTDDAGVRWTFRMKNR